MQEEVADLAGCGVNEAGTMDLVATSAIHDAKISPLPRAHHDQSTYGSSTLVRSDSLVQAAKLQASPPTLQLSIQHRDIAEEQN